MKPAQFEKYLTLYGADLTQWPATLREAAERALHDDPSCRQLFDAEKKFERLLRDAPPPAIPEGLAARIISQAQPRKAEGPEVEGFWASLWAPQKIAAVAACFVLGLMIGWSQPFNGSTTSQISDNTELQLNNFLNYEEITLWPEN